MRGGDCLHVCGRLRERGNFEKSQEIGGGRTNERKEEKGNGGTAADLFLYGLCLLFFSFRLFFCVLHLTSCTSPHTLIHTFLYVHTHIYTHSFYNPHIPLSLNGPAADVTAQAAQELYLRVVFFDEAAAAAAPVVVLMLNHHHHHRHPHPLTRPIQTRDPAGGQRSSRRGRALCLPGD